MNSHSHHQGQHHVKQHSGSPQDTSSIPTPAATDGSAVRDSIGHDHDSHGHVDKEPSVVGEALHSAELEHGSRDGLKDATHENDEGVSQASSSNDHRNHRGGSTSLHGSDMDADHTDVRRGDNSSNSAVHDESDRVIPTSNNLGTDTTKTLQGMGDNSGDNSSVSGSAAVEDIQPTAGQQWITNIPKGESLHMAYTQAAVASLLTRMAASERALQDAYRTISDLSATLGKVIGNVNSMVEFINNMPNNKELLFAMMQNAVASYDAMEASIQKRSFQVSFEFSREPSDAYDLRMTLLPPNEHSSGMPIPSMEKRSEDGSWVLDNIQDVESMVANQITAQHAVNEGYVVGDVVYVKTKVAEPETETTA